LDNAKQSKAVVAVTPTSNNHNSKSGYHGSNQSVEISFNRGGCCGGAHYIDSPSRPVRSLSTAMDHDHVGEMGTAYKYAEDLMPLHRNVREYSPPPVTSNKQLSHHRIKENDYIETQTYENPFEE